MQPQKLTSFHDRSPSDTHAAFQMNIGGQKKDLKDQRQKKDEPKHDGAKLNRPQNDGPQNDGPQNAGRQNAGRQNAGPRNDGPRHEESTNQTTRSDKPANVDASGATSPSSTLAPLLPELDLDILDPAVLRSDLPEVTDQQHRAIFALVAGKSMSAAAVVAGVHRGTVLRWLRDNDHFAAEYNAFQAEIRDKARARLLKAVDDAVNVVINALQHHDPRTALALLSKLAILVPLTPGPTTAGEVKEQREMQTKMKEMMRQIEELMIRLRLP